MNAQILRLKSLHTWFSSHSVQMHASQVSALHVLSSPTHLLKALDKDYSFIIYFRFLRNSIFRAKQTHLSWETQTNKNPEQNHGNLRKIDIHGNVRYTLSNLEKNRIF